jgi:predicted anti-sigma-YlaC factor YlaD
MTTHCTLDQLVALREPDAFAEPGHAEAREHLVNCDVCRAEADRLEQRVARLRAIPVLTPARDRYAELEQRLVRERRIRRARWAGVGGLATAATIVGLLFVQGMFQPQPAEAAQQLSQVMAESRALEGELARRNPEGRAMDLGTAQVAGQLKSRIAAIDEQLQATAVASGQRPADDQLIELWRERVGLMDALVDVHLTGASQVGL